MAIRSKEQLAVRVARELGVLGANQTLPAADSVLIQEAYEDRLSMLKKDNLADWPEKEIPGGAMEGLTLVIADIVAPSFGYPRDAAREGLGLAKLAEYAEVKYDGEAVEADYF